MLGEIIKASSEVVKETSQEIADKAKKVLNDLDKPLNKSEVSENSLGEEDGLNNRMKDLDKPLNSGNDSKEITKNIREITGNNETQTLNESKKADIGQVSDEANYRDAPRKMEPPQTIYFKYPEGADRAVRKEFDRQLKAQERGLNSQTVAENMDNRAAFEQRKLENGNGRDISEGKKAQDIAREKAIQSRIESNQKKGMSYSEAKNEAQEWIKGQAALHNPDQIAGGDPGKVSRMGDANVNSSIGAQWRTRVEQLANGVEDFAKDKTREELENTKMNVKLVAV